MANPFGAISRVSRDVEIRGAKIALYPVPLGFFDRLFADHPGLGAMLDEGNLSLPALVRQAPMAVAEFLAAASGNAGDPAAIEGAAALGLPDQVKLLGAAFTLSLPEELVPLAQAARKAAGRAILAEGARVLARLDEDGPAAREAPDAGSAPPSGDASTS